MSSELRTLAAMVAFAEERAFEAGGELLRAGAYDAASVVFQAVRVLRAANADLTYDAMDAEERLRAQLRFATDDEPAPTAEPPF